MTARGFGTPNMFHLAAQILLLLACGIFSSVSGNETQTEVDISTLDFSPDRSLSIQEVIPYMNDNHQIVISADLSVMNEDIWIYTKSDFSIEEWLPRSLKRFDNIIYYNSGNEIISVKILGVKNTKADVASRSNNNKSQPQDSSSVTPQTDVLPEGLQLPGDTDSYYYESGGIPEGIRLPNSEERSVLETNANIPDGLKLPTDSERDTSDLMDTMVFLTPEEQQQVDLPEGIQFGSPDAQ